MTLEMARHDGLPKKVRNKMEQATDFESSQKFFVLRLNSYSDITDYIDFDADGRYPMELKQQAGLQHNSHILWSILWFMCG